MGKFFYFDLETTGVNYWKHGIHQISGAIEIDGQIKEVFDFKVRPNPACLIEEDALKVGNVTKEQIFSYEPMESIFLKIETMLAKYVNKFDKLDKFHLVGYNNASFDNAFFRAWFKQNSRNQKEAEFGNYFGSWFWADSIDVMVLASFKLRNERLKLKDFKQSTVAKYLGIEVDESKLHDAVYDLDILMQIFRKL